MQHRSLRESGPRAALLIIDLINTFDFADGARLARQASRILPNVLSLRARFSGRGWPVIFCNDNFGQWRSDFRGLVARCERGGPGASIATALRPGPREYFVLKPKHSCFYATPLDLLLRSLRVKRIALAGIAGDGCVLMTALDAHIRDYEVVVASDGTASLTPARNGRALREMKETGVARVRRSRSL